MPGENPLMSASGSGHFEIVKYLVEKEADPNLAEKYLVEHGADVNVKNNAGGTA